MIRRFAQAFLIVVGVLLVVMLFIAAAGAQDIPQPAQITQEKILAEIGRLQVQLSSANEYIGTLQQRIRELTIENAKLKEK